MKIDVGYITSWRRAIFFSLICSIILFGTASTIATTYIGGGILSNIISVGVLLICIGIIVCVLSDVFKRYTGTGTAVIEDGIFTYSDKKRHINLSLDSIDKVDIENISIGRDGTKAIAYRIVIKAGKKKYYIESDRASGRNYNEVDLYRLYLMLQENI